MASIVIVGTQWGDEGKGKIIDLLTPFTDVVVRFQGGANAGHTLVIGKDQTILHLIPSGVLHPGKVCLIGNGVVFDPTVFTAEFATAVTPGATQFYALTGLLPNTTYYSRVYLVDARKVASETSAPSAESSLARVPAAP